MVTHRLKRFGPEVSPPPSPIKRFGPEIPPPPPHRRRYYEEPEPTRKNGMVLLPARYVSPVRKIGEPAEKWVTEAEWARILEEERRLVTLGETPPLVEEPELTPPPEPVEPIEGEGELIDSLRRLYPRMFDPASSFGFSEEEIPLMVVQQIESFANTEPERFLRDLLSKGMDEDAAILLRALGANDADIEEILAIPPLEKQEPIIEPPPQPIERVVMELDGVRQLLIRTEDNSLYNRHGNWVGFYNWADGTVFNPYKATGLVEKTVATLTAGIGDILSVSSGVARRLGYEDVGAELSLRASQLHFYGVPTSSADFTIFSLADPEWYATKVARTVPFALLLIPLAIGGYYTGVGIAASFGLGYIWTAIIGGLSSAALSRPMESALEAGGSYNDAIARGKTEEEARKEFDEVFRNNMTLAGADAFEIAIALAPTPKWVPAALVNSGLARVVTIGGKVVIVGLSEGGEELYQDMIQRHARGEEWQLDPISKEVFAIGFMMGAGMGLGGDVVSNIVNRSQGKMPVEMRKAYDKIISDFTKEGLSQEQAELRALDEVAKTLEGAEIVKESVEEVRVEEEALPEVPEAIVPPEVPAVPEVVLPTPEVERVAKIKYLREQEAKWREAAFKIAEEERGEAPFATAMEKAEDFARQARELEVIPPAVEVAKPPEVAPEVKAMDTRITEINRLLAQKGRLPTGMGTRAEVSLELAHLEAQKDVAGLTNVEQVQTLIDEIENELGLRSMPYHGREPTAFPEYTTSQLDEMLKVYQEARTKLLPEGALKPLPSLPEQTADQISTNLAIPGQPTLTPAQVTRTLDLFGKYITNPSTESAWELTRELRRETLAGRAENLKIRAQELIVSQGIPVEEAMNQAIRETMAGELPAMRTDYLDDLTRDMRDVLFNKVYQTLKDKPFEMMATTTDLTNALLGKPIPRKPGVKGGSAYSRLQRVFGDQPLVLKAIDQVAEQGKMLEDVVEGIYHEVGRPPVPIDEKTATYLRGLSEDVIYQPTAFKEPMPPSPPYEPPIENGINQMPMFPRPARDTVIKVLKEIGWAPVDIGNFLRANKASFDFSFWRQQAPLILNHPATFVQANIEAGKAIWSQKSAEASWQRILNDSLYHLYDQIGVDFLRPLELPKGTSQWMGVEEFGYLTGERLIPRLTEKIPHVKISARAFVTGTNVHNWRIFKNHYNAMLRISEKIASGEVTLKEGEVFSIEKEMTDMAKLLTDLTARGQLGPARALAPGISALFFAPRMALGRILSPRHLVSSNPHIRVEAWRDLVTFVGGIGGLVLLGYMLDLWDVELDPRSAEYMSIRIGTTRIDPWGGYRQYLVFLTRVVTGTGLSSVTGAEYDVDPLGATTHFVRGKASPMASIIADFWVGKTFVGEEVDVANKKQWIERIAPFAVWDVYEAYMDDPARGVAVAIPAIVGAGVQTYTGDWIENFPKLGLPKYSDNLAYGMTEPFYDVNDFWSDTSAQFADVDPATLTEEKGFPDYIRAIVEARIVNEQLRVLPNEKLVSMNADPAEGATFADYYQMWRDREKLVLAGDKAEWTVRELRPDGKYKKVTYKGEKAVEAFDRDERTRNAHLGNFTQRQFALLNQYWAITDKKEQAEFLKKHESEIGTNLRQQWLKAHPKENAQLAAWGQAKIFSLEAYKETQRLLSELDIPDNAIPKFTLPPEGSIENYFQYLEQGGDLGYNSWEVQLIMAQDNDLREFLRREEVETPIRSLEIKIKGREQTDEYNELETDDERDAFRLANPDWVDDQRRIEAIENEGDAFAEVWVDRGHIVDQFESGSSEAMVWLLDNPEAYAWAIEQGLLTDRKEELLDHEDVLRINVEWRVQDEEYDAIVDSNPRVQTELRQAYLDANEEYATERRRRDALKIRHPDDYFRKFPESQHDSYVSWFNNKDLQRPEDLDERIPWFEDEWFLIENKAFHDAMVEFGIWKEHRDFKEIATREVYPKIKVYYLDRVEGKPREDYRWDNQDLDAWLVLTGKVSIPITEKRRRAQLSPTERFLEEIARKRKEFQEALDKLKALLE